MSSKKKVLILCQNYPSNKNPFSQPFIHSRLKAYLEHYEVTVLSFAATENYVFDGIKVLSEKEYKTQMQGLSFDVVVSHAPNIRNHQRFLIQNFYVYTHLIFVFHGYEVIDILKRVYSQPTVLPFKESLPLHYKIYHKIKLPITRLFLEVISKFKPTQFIFVSQTLLDEVKDDLMTGSLFAGTNTHVINNPINPVFNQNHFLPESKFDFVCIRPFDDPKYGVDLFLKIAEKNPQFTFHLYGKGNLPEMKALPANVTIFKSFILPSDFPKLLKQYRAAILPTRWDSQGIMACEIAAFGMPLLTSDLPVCREFLSSYPNVTLIKNNIFTDVDLQSTPMREFKPLKISYGFEATAKKEIDLISRLAAP